MINRCHCLECAPLKQDMREKCFQNLIRHCFRGKVSKVKMSIWRKSSTNRGFSAQSQYLTTSELRNFLLLLFLFWSESKHYRRKFYFWITKPRLKRSCALSHLVTINGQSIWFWSKTISEPAERQWSNCCACCTGGQGFIPAVGVSNVLYSNGFSLGIRW